ncbi:MAG: hypothetical protein NDJ90_14420 [Oligoflexia bacterium]|nr:hypothetical protein [Oligoflexia bacterium]
MKKSTLVLTILAQMLATNLFAATEKVQCFDPNAPEFFVILSLTPSGKIVPVNSRQYVLSDNKPESPYSYLSQDMDESAIESFKSFVAPNGYSIATFVTTADSTSIGVSKDRSQGFYKYQDYGSGSGNSQAKLACQPARQ